MEGDRRFVLVQTVSRGQDETGQETFREVSHVLRARLVRARPGDEEIIETVTAGEWPLVIRFRAESAPPAMRGESVDESWHLLNEAGVPFDIVSVQPLRGPRANSWLELKAVRRRVQR